MMYAMPVEVDSSTFSNLLLKYLKIKYMAGLYEYIYKQLFGDHCKLRVSVRVIKCIIDFTFDDLHKQKYMSIASSILKHHAWSVNVKNIK
jgi:hypothetical protein